MPATANDQNRLAEDVPTGRVDRVMRRISLLGLLLLASLLGMIAAIGDVPPSQTVRDAWMAVCALRTQSELLSSPWPAYLWSPAEFEQRGVTRYASARAYPGYTLYTSADTAGAVLVDMQGNERHRWSAPFRSVWKDASHVPGWIPDHCFYIRKAQALPNGDLLAVYETTVHTPYGCGLAKLDMHGTPKWTFEGNAHHDFCADERGFVYALTHRLRRAGDDDPKLRRFAHVPLIEDCVTVISPEGEPVKTVSILDALVDSPYFRPLLCHVGSSGDVMHNNTLRLVGEGFAARHEGVSAGDVMLCLRNISLLVVLNVESGEVVWATTGPWNNPHDPDPLPNGNLLVFDNFLAQGTRYGSAVVEFDPRRREIAWMYDGTAATPLRSDIRGCQQLLPNGHVLITESDRGRILEVTREHEVVWEYINPVRDGEDDRLIPIVCGAQRFRYDELPFLKELGIEPQDATSISITQASR